MAKGDGAKSDEWGTPPEIFEPLEEEFDFNLDVCARSWNARCDNYFHPGYDGLVQSWELSSGPSRAWMNPPYSRGQPEKWCRKAHEEIAAGNAELVVALLPVSTDTEWWWTYVEEPRQRGEAEVRFVRGRISFTPPPDYEGELSSRRGPNAIVVWRQSVFANSERTAVVGMVEQPDLIERFHMPPDLIIPGVHYNHHAQRYYTEEDVERLKKGVAK